MSGLLKALKGTIGTFVSLVREDGQAESFELVADQSSLAPALTGVWFVDAGAPAGGTGSIDAPFKTFGAAVAAAQAAFTAAPLNPTIVVVPGDYSAEALQTITLDATHTLTVTSFATPNAGLGPYAQPSLPQLAVPVGNLVADGVAWIGVTAPQVHVATGNVSLTGAAVASVTCDRLRASQSRISAGTMTTDTELSDCIFGPMTSPSFVAWSCRMLGLVLITGNVSTDAFTNSFGALSASGTLKVFGAAAQEKISVTVPAVLAGNVGYVDVTMVAGLAAVPADAPVTGAPQVDLVAAGVGGGFINCRAAAAGIIRCAFVGPLAGGAVNFTFSANQYP